MTTRLTEALAFTSKQTNLIGKMYRGETIHIRGILGGPLDNCIHVEGKDPLMATIMDREGHTLGITRSSLDILMKENNEKKSSS